MGHARGSMIFRIINGTAPVPTAELARL